MRRDKIKKFQKFIWDFYYIHKRDLPWRHTQDPYKIMVSEVMLQQTQVSRGLVKYPEFLKVFPTVQSLAKASTADILRVWQGLGYNRRALMLKRAVEIIVKEYKGKVPSAVEKLDALPGIGINTAGSIAAYAFNLPVVFIETNIRKIYIHHFFKDRANITDVEILPIIEKTLDKNNPREWYWALMDYGAYLSKVVPNPNLKSKHYVKQSRFEGSLRQLRGKIIKLLLEKQRISEAMLRNIVRDERYKVAVEQLLKEGFLVKVKKYICLK